MATRNPVSILGISAFYHDSAAALVVDGDIVAAAQEERFTRKRHDHEFPAKAIEYCLKEAGLEPEQVSYVVFYDKPLKKFDRILETYFAYAPSGFWSFKKALPSGSGAPYPARDPEGPSRPLQGHDGLHRSSPVPRRLGLLPLTL